MTDFTVLIDHREKMPFFIDKVGDDNFPDLNIEWGHMQTGDYTLKGYNETCTKESIVIERKSLNDLFMSTGKNRQRLINEFERMMDYSFAALVIEADYRTIIKNPPPESGMNPKAVFRSLIAFSQRYNLHVYPCPNRQFAEKTTYLILRRFWDDCQRREKK